MNSLAKLRQRNYRTINGIMTRIAPESLKKPTVKNTRREQAASDPFNYISQCCMNLID